MRGPEGQLQDKILKDLRSYGKYMVCTKVIKNSDNGFPDIYFTCCITGSVWIETKRLEGEAAELQLFRIDKLNKCGSKAFLCNSWVRWQEIKKKLAIPLPSEMVLFSSII